MGLGENLDHQFEVKFHGDLNGDNDSLGALKRCLNSKMAHKGLIGARNRKNLELEQEEKLNHQCKVKFHSQSNGDGLDALKRCLDPEMDHKSLIGA